MKVLYFILILIIVLIDQLTKKAALLKLKDGEVISCCRGFIKLGLVKNSGAAFGILKDRQILLKAITIPVILFVMYYLYAFAIPDGSAIVAVSLSFVIGGAIGNLLDRLIHNHVIDFLTLKFKRFPVFNAADIFIFMGTIVFAANNIF